MKHYELTYIVPMSYTVDDLPSIKERVVGTLKEHGASIVKEHSLGKLKFAYPINKLSHGYYEVVEFDIDPSQVAELERIYRIETGVVRYVIVSKRIKTEAELAAEQKLREKIAEQDKNRKSIFDEEDEDDLDTPRRKPRKTPRKESTYAPREEKTEIVDLDKKLDAILEGEDMLQ